MQSVSEQELAAIFRYWTKEIRQSWPRRHLPWKRNWIRHAILKLREWDI